MTPPVPSLSCDHSGFWTCVSSLDRGAHKLRFRMVCDDCREPMKQLGEQGYEPRPKLTSL